MAVEFFLYCDRLTQGRSLSREMGRLERPLFSGSPRLLAGTDAPLVARWSGWIAFCRLHLTLFTAGPRRLGMARPSRQTPPAASPRLSRQIGVVEPHGCWWARQDSHFRGRNLGLGDKVPAAVPARLSSHRKQHRATEVSGLQSRSADRTPFAMMLCGHWKNAVCLAYLAILPDSTSVTIVRVRPLIRGSRAGGAFGSPDRPLRAL